MHRNPILLLSACILLIIAFSVISGCAGNRSDRGSVDMDMDYMNKLDAPLRSVLFRAEHDEEAPIDVLIQLTGTADSDAIDMLRHYQLEVRSTVDSIVTARGTADAIRRSASDPRIVSVSLSQIRELKE